MGEGRGDGVAGGDRDRGGDRAGHDDRAGLEGLSERAERVGEPAHTRSAGGPSTAAPAPVATTSPFLVSDAAGEAEVRGIQSHRAGAEHERSGRGVVGDGVGEA